MGRPRLLPAAARHPTLGYRQLETRLCCRSTCPTDFVIRAMREGLVYERRMLFQARP
jgi:hypothetical protein